MHYRRQTKNLRPAPDDASVEWESSYTSLDILAELRDALFMVGTSEASEVRELSYVLREAREVLLEKAGTLGDDYEDAEVNTGK